MTFLGHYYVGKSHHHPVDGINGVCGISSGGEMNSFTPKNGKNQELYHPLFYFIKSLVILVLFYIFAKLLPEF